MTKKEMIELIENESNKYAKRFYKKLVDDGYSLVGNSRYVKSDELVDTLCNNNHHYSVRPNDFNKGVRCSKCYHISRTLTHNEFLTRIKEIYGNEYIVESEFKTTRIPIKIKHVTCGKSRKSKPSDLLSNNTRCPFCASNAKKTQEKFEYEVYNMYGDEYKVIDEYINAGTSIRFYHSNCNSIIKKQPNHILSGSGCGKCLGLLKKTTKQFKKEVYELVGDEYEVVGEYKNTHSLIKMKHLECNHTFQVIPKNFLYSDIRCSKCRTMTNGEMAVAKYLTDNNIPYKFQHTFDDLRYKRLLRLDFYLPDYNLIIEFDGQFHYKAIPFGKTERHSKEAEVEFKLNQIRDNIKNKYAKDNNINLLRINYLDIDKVGFLIEQKLSSITAKEVVT